jgi:uncharacterized membrane protein
LQASVVVRMLSLAARLDQDALNVESRFHVFEIVAVTYDGADSAQQALDNLRETRDDRWLPWIGVIEHDSEGEYTVKSRNPDVDEAKAGKDAGIGGLTGGVIGIIGGPLGVAIGAGIGAAIGGMVGATGESAFKPTVEQLKGRLPQDASMLVLVGGPETQDEFLEAIGARPDSDIFRLPLTIAQTEELTERRSSA